MAKKAAGLSKPMNKTELLNDLAEQTGVAKKDVAAVIAALGGAIEKHIKKGSVGTFVLPGLLKVTAVKKPAKKAQKDVPNPFRKGELMDVAAKPASVKIKLTALKKIKDMVA